MPSSVIRLQYASPALFTAIAIAALIASPRELRAQALSSSVDIGIASGSAFAGPSPSALLLQPALRWDHPNTSVTAQASWLASPTAHMDGDAAIMGRYYSQAYHNLRFDLGATAQRIAGADVVRPSNALQGDANVSYAFGASGMWVGTAQRASTLDSLPSHMQTFSVGGWHRVGSAILTTTLTSSNALPNSDPFTANDPSSPGSGLGDSVPHGASVPTRHYSDLESTVYWSHGPLALDGLIGTRVSTSYGQRSTWGHAQASFALGDQFALVAAAGSRASEPAISRLGGNFFSFGVRVASVPWMVHALHPGARSSASSFGVRAEGATRIIYVRAPAARTIELMADFTDWQPVVMRHTANDEWEIAMQIAPGAHRVNIRVDGGQWSAPPGAGTVQDEFNGVVGLVVVP